MTPFPSAWPQELLTAPAGTLASSLRGSQLPGELDREPARDNGKATAQFLTVATTPSPRAPPPRALLVLISPLSLWGLSVLRKVPRRPRRTQGLKAPSSGPPSRVAIFSQARTPKWLQGAFTTSGKSPVFLFALEMGACFHPRDSRQRSPLSKIPLRESRVPVFPFPEPPKHNSVKEEKRKY